MSDLKGQEEVDVTRAWTVDKLPISRRSIPTASDVARWSHLDGIEFPELSNETVGIIIGSDVPEAIGCWINASAVEKNHMLYRNHWDGYSWDRLDRSSS